MTLTTEQRLELFKKQGWKYNKETKELISPKNHVIKRKDCTTQFEGKRINASVKTLINYLNTGYYKRDVSSLFIKKNRQPDTNYKPVNYVKDVDLTYEIIISKGKGYLTQKAHEMLYKIASNMILKFTYFNEDDKYDCLMSGYIAMLNGWYSFNEKKYDKSFSYYSEICKRGLTKGIKTDKKLVSLSNFNNYLI